MNAIDRGMDSVDFPVRGSLIHEAVSVPHFSVILDRLLKSGLVVRVTGGLYELADLSYEPPAK